MNKLFILSGPSGAGEDSVVKGISNFFDIEKVVTTTTREMRENEENGKPYYFISKEEFKKGINKNRFFEYALQDRGNYYGVTHDEIERVLKSPKVALYRLDYKGVKTIKKLMRGKAVAIFIYAEMEILKKRIMERSNADREFVNARMKYAKGWFDNREIFDYEVHNKQGELDETIEKVIEIIEKEK